eukprot:Skav219727  [mRNA]  locus=scaffold301:228784:236605:- [translate_table: standard]
MLKASFLGRVWAQTSAAKCWVAGKQQGARLAALRRPAMATRSIGLSSGEGQSVSTASSKPAPTVGRTSAAKLASLDWPPPPSPASSMRPQSGALDLGRAIERGLNRGGLGPTPAFEQEDGRNRVSRATELHNRKVGS